MQGMRAGDNILTLTLTPVHRAYSEQGRPMADNIYDIAVSGTTAGMILFDHDGGSDWLILTGTYSEASNITLNYTSDAGIATSAWGMIYDTPSPSKTLRVGGLIENAMGSDSEDYISGNTGDNFLYGDNTFDGAGGNDTIFADEGNDTVYGGSGNDNIGGMEGDDLLVGDTGADLISGGSGIDTVVGGGGADSMSGGAEIGDMLAYGGSDAGVIVRLQFGVMTIGEGGHAANDSINGFSDVYGSNFDDRIIELDSASQKLANWFFGSGGADILLLNGGDDMGNGGEGADRLFGGSGKDSLLGEAGVDRLNGGNGADQLTGGGGGDYFIFTRTSDSTASSVGRDRITDFNRAAGDKIDLRQIDAQSGIGNQSFDFIGTSGFTGDKGDLRYIKSGANIVVLGDINGDKRADFSIMIEDASRILGSDFLL